MVLPIPPSLFLRLMKGKLQNLIDYLEGFIYSTEKPSPKLVECYLKAIKMVMSDDEVEDDWERVAYRLGLVDSDDGVSNNGDSRPLAKRPTKQPKGW